MLSKFGDSYSQLVGVLSNQGLQFRSKNLGPVPPCSPHRESDDTPTLLLDLVIHMH